MSVGLPIGCQSRRISLAVLQVIFPGTSHHLYEPDSEWLGVKIRISFILNHYQPHVFQHLAGLQ